MQRDPLPIPQPGDVVIEREEHSAPTWVLGPCDHPKQIRCSTYDEALERAKSYSRKESVDVFYTEDAGLTFSLVVRHR